ncbi:hypothetical protein UPYG_G00094650 [Umbra pygmaea]|uniref:Activating transcription factor 7-interacting protein Fn3 domain-containing protein n=1 Tax=Umbra pygmaea TaxID=75934 RepID=A0ABD0WZT1_UMBPY
MSRSTSEVCVLPDMMRKRRRENETGSPDTEEPIRRFSMYEVQGVLQQEVSSALKETESKMEALLERVQRLECEPNFDITIRKLEAHIKKVKRRGDAAIAYVRTLAPAVVKGTQNQHKVGSGPVDLKESGRSTMDPVGYDSDEDTGRKKMLDVFKQKMQITNSKKSMDQDRKQGENGKTQNSSPPVLSSPPVPSHHPSPPVLSPQVPKSEPTPIPVSSPLPEDVTPVKTEVTIKTEESSPPSISSLPPHCITPSKADLISRLPPLPATPFPSSIPLEAASHSIPPKPVVHLARIQNPTPCLVITWRVTESEPAPSDMDSYSIYISQESRHGSGIFPSWRNVGVVKALALPMAVTVTKYQSGTTFVTVVGKDRYGRYGPYSDIQTVMLA